MNLRSYVSAIDAGVAIPLGFGGANDTAEFIKGFGNGTEGTLNLEKSTFEVVTNAVKKQDSPAFGKLVGNVIISVNGPNNKTESVRVDFGTLAALCNGGGKTTLKSVQVMNADGTPYKTRSGKEIYNLVADNPPVYSKELMEKSLVWIETSQKAAAPVQS